MEVGEIVLVRDCRGHRRWTVGKVKGQMGPLSYSAEIPPGVIGRRHFNQLRRSRAAAQEELSDVTRAPTPPSSSRFVAEKATSPATCVTEASFSRVICVSYPVSGHVL